jgi:glycine cleavage system H protein
MNFPKELKYSPKDEWIKVEDNTASIGISDYAQDALSDIVYLEYAVSVGDVVSKGDILGTVESVKAASDVYFPISGTVLKVNEELLDTPENVNSDPYGAAWIIKLELSSPEELDELMNAEKYEAYVQERI